MSAPRVTTLIAHMRGMSRIACARGMSCIACARGMSRPCRTALLPAAALLLAVAFCGTALPGTASAAVPFSPGADPEAFKGRPVAGFGVEGLPDGLAGGLTAGLVLSGKSKLIGTDYPIFYPSLLEADLERTRLYLARRGYPHARVDALLHPRDHGRKVDVRLRVVPGAPVRVDSVTVRGAPAEAARAMREAVALGAGDVFSEPRLDSSVQDMVRVLREHGYAKAEIVSTVDRVDSTRVSLRFEARPGARYVFGRTVVEGASADLRGLVRKTVAIDRGDTYSSVPLRRARDSLRLLGLFRQVRVETREAGGDTLDVVARLSDRDPRTVETGLGYWTDDQFRGHARWTHRNLLRAGRGAEVDGSYSIYQREIGSRFWWPALFGARTRAEVGGSVTWENEDSYDLRDTELKLSGHYRHSFRTTYQAGISLADVKVTSKTSDPEAFRAKGGLLTILSAGWNRDTADDRLYPHRGSVSWVQLQWSPPGALSDNPFVSGEGHQATYLPLGPFGVLASRVALGLAAPLGNSQDLLPNQRFYAGGATSNRGFKRRRLGPLDSRGDPIGGEAKLELSTELRFPLFWRFNGVMFVDAAQAWARRQDMNPNDLAFAVGPGLMVRTPIGPVRVDVGTRLGSAPGNPPRSVLHITIGNPY